jgi:hypothetical protein
MRLNCLKFLTFAICILKVFSIIKSFSNKTEIFSKEMHNPEIKAISDIVKEFLIKQGIDFDFYVLGRFTTEVRDIIDGVLSKIPIWPLEIIHDELFENYNKEEGTLFTNRPAMIFLDFDHFANESFRT